jgi:predicted metalloprotease
VAHELGHHVQKILGIEQKMQRLVSEEPAEKNHLSVDLELQADCLAGVWGHSTEQRKIVDEADIEEGLKSAAAVGDDHLQKMSRGTVSPETFTHGTSAQRMMWFKKGLSEGDVKACNTFNGSEAPSE